MAIDDKVLPSSPGPRMLPQRHRGLENAFTLKRWLTGGHFDEHEKHDVNPTGQTETLPFRYGGLGVLCRSSRFTSSAAAASFARSKLALCRDPWPLEQRGFYRPGQGEEMP